MAFQFKFTATTDSTQESILIVDETGTGTAGNPTGYGYNGAPTAADITACVLQLFIPDASTMNVSDSAISIDLFALGFPLSGSIVITNVMAGLASTAKFPDGMYLASITETYFDTNDTSTYEQSITMIQIVTCCISNKTVSSSCACTNKNLSTSLISANLKLQAISYACSDAQKANLILSATEACAAGFCKNCG